MKWLAGVGASMLILLLPVNTLQAWRLEAKAENATNASLAVKTEVEALRYDFGKLEVTLRAFVAEKNAETTMRIALLEQRLAVLEKESDG
jgi:hypothetical protein